MTDETINLLRDTARAQEVLSKWHDTDMTKVSDITELIDDVRKETLDEAAQRGAQAAAAFIEENEILDDVYDYVFQAIRGEQL